MPVLVVSLFNRIYACYAYYSKIRKNKLGIKPHPLHAAILFFTKFMHLICWCFFREYVVDLVVVPGSICNPDSSINGQLLSSVSSPFKTSCTAGLANYAAPVADWNRPIADDRCNSMFSNSQYSGTVYNIIMQHRYQMSRPCGCTYLLVV
jgi:hypothetical protein